MDLLTERVPLGQVFAGRRFTDEEYVEGFVVWSSVDDSNVAAGRLSFLISDGDGHRLRCTVWKREGTSNRVFERALELLQQHREQAGFWLRIGGHGCRATEVGVWCAVVACVSAVTSADRWLPRSAVSGEALPERQPSECRGGMFLSWFT